MEVPHNSTECCMCGDVGFPDKLFQCVRCVHRFQHSYCGNYYDETSAEAATVCDWCRSDERSGGKHKKAVGKEATAMAVANPRSEYLEGERIKHSDNGNDDTGGGGGGSGGKGKFGGSGSGSSSSGRPSGRRYKLLKDVMC